MKIKKLLVSLFSVLLVFCAVPNSQAVVWSEMEWKVQICSWLKNREMGCIRGHMNCLTRRNNLCRAIGIVKKYYLLWRRTGEFSYKNLNDDLHSIWGLDEEIEKSLEVSKTLSELYDNLQNMEKAYYRVADDLSL